MRLDCFCEILKNEKVEDYMAVSGKNTLVLNHENKIIAKNTSNVLWCGSSSPFPTPSGIWECEYISNHPKFGKCFYVKSDREADVFIHFGKKSYGCFMINSDAPGNLFMEALIKNRPFVVCQNEIVDSRLDEDKEVNPIDYSNMDEFIK